MSPSEWKPDSERLHRRQPPHSREPRTPPERETLSAQRVKQMHLERVREQLLWVQRLKSRLEFISPQLRTDTDIPAERFLNSANVRRSSSAQSNRSVRSIVDSTVAAWAGLSSSSPGPASA